MAGVPNTISQLRAAVALNVPCRERATNETGTNCRTSRRKSMTSNRTIAWITNYNGTGIYDYLLVYRKNECFAYF
jgi:hypothetical protein